MTIAIPFCSRLHDYEEAVRRAGGEPRIVDLRRDRPEDIIRTAAGRTVAPSFWCSSGFSRKAAESTVAT